MASMTLSATATVNNMEGSSRNLVMHCHIATLFSDILLADQQDHLRVVESKFPHLEKAVTIL